MYFGSSPLVLHPDSVISDYRVGDGRPEAAKRADNGRSERQQLCLFGRSVNRMCYRERPRAMRTPGRDRATKSSLLECGVDTQYKDDGGGGSRSWMMGNEKPPNWLRRSVGAVWLEGMRFCGSGVSEEFVEVCSWEVAAWACCWGEVFVKEDAIAWDI